MFPYALPITFTDRLNVLRFKGSFYLKKCLILVLCYKLEFGCFLYFLYRSMQNKWTHLNQYSINIFDKCYVQNSKIICVLVLDKIWKILGIKVFVTFIPEYISVKSSDPCDGVSCDHVVMIWTNLIKSYIPNIEAQGFKEEFYSFCYRCLCRTSQF